MFLRYFGGWVAPNIYYLGSAGVVTVRKGDFNIRIGGVSGIFKIGSFNNSKLENYPFT